MKASLLVDAPILDKKQLWIKKVDKPHFDHEFHFHKTCELLWIIEGRGNMIIGDHVGKFEKDDLYLMGSGLPHIFRCAKEYYSPKSTLRTIAISIYFTDDFLLGTCDDPAFQSIVKKFLHRSERGVRFTGHSRKQMIDIFQRLLDQDSLGQLGSFFTLIQQAQQTEEVLYLASAVYQIKPPKAEMDRFVEVYDYILKNYQKTITLAKVSSICGMSENAFCRFFKAKTQKTLTQFVNEIRISHACALLQHKNQTIKSVYWQCGYNNPVFFHRAFKRITGTTPKQYQSTCLQLDDQY